MSPISFRAHDVNLYRYVTNDSQNKLDPLGLQADDRWQYEKDQRDEAKAQRDEAEIKAALLKGELSQRRHDMLLENIKYRRWEREWRRKSDEQKRAWVEDRMEELARQLTAYEVKLAQIRQQLNLELNSLVKAYLRYRAAAEKGNTDLINFEWSAVLHWRDEAIKQYFEWCKEFGRLWQNDNYYYDLQEYRYWMQWHWPPGPYDYPG